MVSGIDFAQSLRQPKHNGGQSKCTESWSNSAVSSGRASRLGGADAYEDNPARAQLAITPAGTTLGFSLSTFATGFFNSGGIGPIGMAVNGAGQVIVDDVENNTNYLFNDVDGQAVGSAISSTPFSRSRRR